jgi:hypothetical protein
MEVTDLFTFLTTSVHLPEFFHGHKRLLIQDGGRPEAPEEETVALAWGSLLPTTPLRLLPCRFRHFDALSRPLVRLVLGASLQGFFVSGCEVAGRIVTLVLQHTFFRSSLRLKGLSP